jgi:hypothetical protein
MWFETLTGFREENAEQVRDNIVVDGETMTSKVNGKTFNCGRLETPTLADFRSRVLELNPPKGKLQLSEVVADVQLLHQQNENTGALFQVASQFNLLEMVAPHITPEHGVDIYGQDQTQGPACAIACGAGTIYRNYFANVNDQIGQTSENQIDCLRHMGNTLGNTDERLWAMRNGYALATADGLREISKRLTYGGEEERDNLRRKLRIGVQWNTEVTIGNATHTVTQAYGSAVPVSYSSHATELWSDFGQLILEASYEAAICAAILNSAETGNNKVYLTLLGGGAFGNRDDWIITSIRRALQSYAEMDLDVAIVSYRASKPPVQELIKSL